MNPDVADGGMLDNERRGWAYRKGGSQLGGAVWAGVVFVGGTRVVDNDAKCGRRKEKGRTR